METPQFSPSEVLERLLALPSGKTVLLLGAVDTGKTTFVREAVGFLTSRGKSVAVLDCDLGQGDLGPPGTIGVTLVPSGTAREGRTLRDLAPLETYFIGATSPARHVIDLCVGARRLVDTAQRNAPDVILIDTGGIVHGNLARQLTRRMAELLAVHAVIAIARDAELDALLGIFRHLKMPEIWRLGVSPEVGRKTQAARATRRAARFLAAFTEAREIVCEFDAVSLVGTWLGTGQPVQHHIRQFLSESLRLPVMHAEQTPGGGLYVVVNGERWDPNGLAAIESYFKTHSVTTAPAQKFAHLLVGLVDAKGLLLDIGTIERIDFPKRSVTILTSCRKPAAIAQIWLGSLRVKRDGKELGETRPGEV